MGHAQWIVHNGGQRGSGHWWREHTCITLEITYVFTQIISENISLNYGINFQVSEHCKGPLFRQQHCLNTPYGANSYQRIISREGEIGEKIRACHSFQNTSISQRRTSQMIRRSPTAYESRIYVLTITLRKIFLVFQLGEGTLIVII